MSLRNALQAVKSEIKVVVPVVAHIPKKYSKVEKVVKPIQYLNGHVLSWSAQNGSKKKYPFIQEPRFWIQYPNKAEDIKLPVGCVRATYNSEKKRVEYFKRGSTVPIRVCVDSKHEPLPIPKYFRHLENVEEIFDINLETCEITSTMNVNILPEEVHWKLRLEEFEKMQVASNVDKKIITYRLQKYLRNLEILRGLTVDKLSQPIPKVIASAIEYAEKKQREFLV